MEILHFTPLLIGWFVKTVFTDDGHEQMTRQAAKGLSASDLATLIKGVRSPDVESIVNHIKLDEQHRHALRRTLSQSTSAALKEATDHLKKLHREALAASSKDTRLHKTGESLHLIQDSFSPAHAQRQGRKIKKLRNYGPANLVDGLKPGHHFTDEHIFPSDGRDSVKVSGRFTAQAREAIDASGEYLDLIAGHAGANPPSRAAASAELDAFIAKWLSQ